VKSFDLLPAPHSDWKCQ